MLVRDVMTRDVITADPEMGIKEAARTLADNKVGSLVVVKGNRVIGILTERDILHALADCEGAGMESLKVGDAMTNYVIFTTPESRIETAIGLMAKNKIKKLPVLGNERLVGIVTASDIITVQPDMIRSIKKLLSARYARKAGV